jgi:hypothetical protein
MMKRQKTSVISGHLDTAANLTDGDFTEQAKRWVKNMKADRCQGHTSSIVDELEQHAFRFAVDAWQPFGDNAEAGVRPAAARPGKAIKDCGLLIEAPTSRTATARRARSDQRNLAGCAEPPTARPAAAAP